MLPSVSLRPNIGVHRSVARTHFISVKGGVIRENKRLRLHSNAVPKETQEQVVKTMVKCCGAILMKDGRERSERNDNSTCSRAREFTHKLHGSRGAGFSVLMETGAVLRASAFSPHAFGRCATFVVIPPTRVYSQPQTKYNERQRDKDVNRVHTRGEMEKPGGGGRISLEIEREQRRNAHWEEIKGATRLNAVKNVSARAYKRVSNKREREFDAGRLI